jgi:hypothetical protein
MISFFFWLKRQKNLLSRPTRSRRWAARPRRGRLGLEELETRLVPANNVTATLAVSPTTTNLGDTLSYTGVITNNSGSTATGVQYSDTLDANTTLVPGSIHASPIANNDSYNWVGNTLLDSAAAGLPGLFANDTAPLGEAIHLVSNTNPASGSLVIHADGSFVYTPNANTTHAASDSFSYTINNTAIAGATSTATVTISLAGSVWYVDNSLGANGSGTIASKFNNIASAVSAAATGDTIFLYKGNANYGAITLTANQQLIGQGVDLTFDTGAGIVTLVPKGSGNTPTIGGTVTLSNSNTVEGLNISSGASTGLSGSSVSGETVNQVSVTSTTGTAVSLSSVGGSLAFITISSNGAASGISLVNTTGSFTVTGDGANALNGTGGNIQNSTGNGVVLTNATNVFLTHMNINNSAVQGIFGTGVNGFIADWDSFSNNGTSNAGSGQGAIFFGDAIDNTKNGLIGTAATGSNPTRISNSNFASSAANHVQIDNSSGTLTQLDVTKNTFTGLGRNPPAGHGGSGFQIELRGTAVASVIFTGTAFTDNFSAGATGAALGDSDLTFNILGGTDNGANTFTNSHDAIKASNKDNAHLTTEISNNTFTNNDGNAIFVGNGVPPVSNTSLITARILNNTITAPSDEVNHVVLLLFSGAGAISHVRIDGNNITNHGPFDGININTPDSGTSPNFTAVVTNNTVTNDATSTNAINLNARQSSTAVFKVEGNTTTAPGNIGIQVRQVGSATVSLERGGSASNDPAVVLPANNPNATGTFPTNIAGTVAVVANSASAVTLSLTPAALPAPTFGVAYSQSITASGGTSPNTFSLISGALPTGLSLSTAGVLSGTPTASGTFTFTVQAVDSAANGANIGSKTYSLTIANPAITLSNLASSSATVGSFFSQTITASGGTAPFHFTITAGSLPPGLFLNQDTGVISGVPTTTSGSPFSFTVQATDSSTGTGPFSNTQSYSISVNSPTVSLSSINIGALPASSGNNTETITYQATVNNPLTSPADAITFTTQGTVSGSFTGSPIMTDDPNTAAPNDATVVHLIPSVTSSTANLAANSASMTISGSGFDDATPGNNVVTFNNGATGTVTAATFTQLTVTALTGLVAGSLTASVSVQGTSSGAAVQVATVTPVVTMSTANLAVNATSMTIAGFGFDSTAGNNTVVFSGGATGAVTAATNTQLTITSLSGLTVGVLTAVVTSNGQSSGAAVQVATVVPVITSSTANLAATATSMTIAGLGFDTNAANDVVTFSGGATGTVTSATATQLTVTSLTGLIGGALNASVSVNGVSSGAPVQVATVTPVVTPSTANLTADAASMTIAGFGFDTNAANDSVTFSGGATGTVTSATATTLTVTGLSGLVAGALNASVTVNSVSSGAPVQVATVVPVITSSTADLAANATSMTIAGFGFDTNTANDVVTFSGGATGTVTTATATTLTVTSLSGLVGGVLNASVTVNSVSSGAPVQVATVVPVVTSNTADLTADSTSMTIAGFGFDTNAANDAVTFSGGVTGTVTSATAMTLTVTSLSGLVGGVLNASVTVNSVSSGAPVQVATVVPVVTSSTADLTADSTSMTIAGFGFDTNAANDVVTFSGGVTGTVTTATATTLTVTGLSGLVAGALNASVTVNSVSSGAPVQVATVVPVITSSTADLAATATSMTIAGFGFDTNAANDSVTFSGGATGTVTSATATTLTVTSLSGLVAGALNASVTVNSVSSGAPVQVATVVPVITSSTADLAANATSMTIAGFGFDTNAANDSVTFSGGATGTVTSATATTLTVTSLSGLVAGVLNASVTVNSVSSGAPVQVATVVPVVTASTAVQLKTQATMTINGFGFSNTPANNSVAFNLGAVGTVTAASATQLTITFTTQPTIGHLTAVVTTNGVSSGAAVQVATITARANIAGRANETGQWWVALSTGTSFNSSLWAMWNPSATWVDVLTGDFNGDGLADIAARDANTGIWWVALSTGSSFTTTLWTTWNPAVTWADVRVGDFNGDGKADIAGRDLATGNWWVALSSGSSFSNAFWTHWNPQAVWVDVRVGDFNGDGKDDLAGHVFAGGSWWVAQSTGSSFTNALWTIWNPNVTWTDVRVGDFNGDGKVDIAGRDLASGNWWVGLSSGSSFTNTLWTTWNPQATWVDVLVADFNGDGKADIVGRVKESGAIWVATSTGTSFTNGLWDTWSPLATWVDVQVGDYNGDGKADIAGRDLKSGAWWIGLSNGSSMFTTTEWTVWNASVVWVSTRTGDFA